MTSHRFNKYYFILFLVLFSVEVYIGLGVHDNIIRPYGGDFLIVILLYCLLKSFVALPVLPAAIGVLFFAYTVEISQYFHLVNLLGLQHSKTTKLLLGTTFSFSDLFSYTLAFITILSAEKLRIALKNF